MCVCLNSNLRWREVLDINKERQTIRGGGEERDKLEAIEVVQIVYLYISHSFRF